MVADLQRNIVLLNAAGGPHISRRHPKKVKRSPFLIPILVSIFWLYILLSVSVPKPVIATPQVTIETVYIYREVTKVISVPVTVMVDPPMYAQSTSESGLKFIAFYEGFSNAAYLDSGGNCTVGIGHLIRMGKCLPGDWPLYVTNDQAWTLLRDDVSKVDFQIYKAGWNLKQNEFDAVSSLLMNLGLPNFIKTPIYTTLQAGDFTKVPNAIRQTTCCVSGLIARRASGGLTILRWYLFPMIL